MVHARVCHAPEMHYKLFIYKSVHSVFFFNSKGTHYSPFLEGFRQTWKTWKILKKGEPGKS